MKIKALNNIFYRIWRYYQYKNNFRIQPIFRSNLFTNTPWLATGTLRLGFFKGIERSLPLNRRNAGFRVGLNGTNCRFGIKIVTPSDRARRATERRVRNKGGKIKMSHCLRRGFLFFPIIISMLLLFGVDRGFSESTRQLSDDPRLRLVVYRPNTIIPIDTSVFINTQILFGKAESIVDIQNGDSAAWTYHMQPTIPNILTIKPIVMGSDTDLSVMTRDQEKQIRIYRFHITSAKQRVIDKEKQVYSIQFVYPDDQNRAVLSGIKQMEAHLSSVLENLANNSTLNWNYSFHGDERLKPLKVFDDGKFTYLQFSENQIIPAIFSVENANGTESVVNTRKKGSYVLVQEVPPQLTLRNGKDMVASVFNNTLIQQIRQ